MDERHWWIATRVNESLSDQIKTNVSELESSFLEFNNSNCINLFFDEEGPLYLYFAKCSNTSIKSVHVSSEIKDLTDKSIFPSEKINILMIIKKRNSTISITNFENELFCIELKNYFFQNITTIFSHGFIPLLLKKYNSSANSDKVHALSSQLSSIWQNIQNYTDQLYFNTNQEEPIHSTIDMNKEWQDPVKQHEIFVTDVMTEIETILEEANDRTSEKDIFLLGEMGKWQYRNHLLQALVNQMKGKMFKNSIGLLVSKKSKLIKKWRLLESQITEALNTSRDKMKYLETFKNECIIMENYISLPNCLLMTIPKIFKKMKQKESFSRSFMRSGLMGSFLSMIRRQILTIINSNIQSIIGYNQTPQDIWTRIHQEILDDSVENMLNMSLNHIKSLLPKEDLSNNIETFNSILFNNGLRSNTLLGLLKLSTVIFEIFMENVTSLREILNVSNPPKYSTVSGNKPTENFQNIISSPDQSNNPNNVNIYDDNEIFSNWVVINGEVRKFIEICEHLLKFEKMMNTKIMGISTLKFDIIHLLEKASKVQNALQYNNKKKHSSEEDLTDPYLSDMSEDETSQGTQSWSFSTLATSRESLQWLLNLNPENITDVSLWEIMDKTKSLVSNNVISSFNIMEITNLDRTSLTESLQIGKTFESHQDIMNNFDKIFSVFLNLLFLRPMRTEESLSILSKFDSLKSRKSIKGVLCHKICEIFLNFKNDITGAYESYKGFKNQSTQAPGLSPLFSTVAWIQKLLSTIEIPMIRFQNIKEVTQMKEYEHIVKQYNKVSKHLITYQSAFIRYWLSSVDSCVSKLKNPLLIIDFVNNKITLNAPEHVIVTINETRNMIRIQNQLSPAVIELVKSEARIKSFNSQLCDAIQYFENVKQSIKPEMFFLFKNHIKLVMQTFQTGSSSLTWSTINIDVFLHKVMSAVANLESVIKDVMSLHNEILDLLTYVETKKIFQFSNILGKKWYPDEFLAACQNDLQASKTNVKISLEKCELKLQNIKQTLSITDKTDSQFVLYESETSIFHQLKEIFNNSLTKVLFRSVVNNIVYLAICTNCKNENIESLINKINYNPMVEMSNRSCMVHGEDVFCKNEMRFVSPESEQLLSNESPHLIKFILLVKYEIPMIKFEPDLEIIQVIIEQLGQDIICFHNEVKDFSGGIINLSAKIESDLFYEFSQMTSNNFSESKMKIQDIVYRLNEFEFLWKMTTEQLDINESLSNIEKYMALKEKIKQVLHLKNNLKQLPQEIEMEYLVISTKVFRDVLLSLLNDWQNKHGQSLHEGAKRLLDEATLYREGVAKELKQDVHELEQLNELLLILDQIFDLDLKIDSIYQPIESMYTDLEIFELPILRSEETELNNLRQYWNSLIRMAESQRNQLLTEKRNVFHQELDKQMKKFTVEVIQFRNHFDFECPNMAGSDPIEVEKKLENFRNQYSIYEEKRNTLVAISKLFGLKIQSFHELESMKEDLLLLTQLYSLYQKFSKFETNFNDKLWHMVDLDDVYVKLTEFWDECLALPSKLKEKESYSELKGKIDYLIKIHSILVNLASKEIRNRHWIQVMQVTGANFQLEAGTFKCSDLTSIRLLENKKEIDRICYDAKKEMELETKLNQIEEEWTEQVLVFQNHPRRGPVVLEVKFTNSLLQQLEDSQILLMNMFNSRHIEPMKEEAAQWAAKLMEISEVLDLWIEVQQLWFNLESVFINSAVMKDLSQEYKRFERLDKSYVKSMLRVYETKNVFQCCISNEYSKKSFLKNIQQGLESCFDSLRGYLQQKRNLFHRLWFVSDATILSILNCSSDLSNLRVHLPSIFTAVSDIKIDTSSKGEQNLIEKVFSLTREEIVLLNKVSTKDEIINCLNTLANEIEQSISSLSNEAIKYISMGENLEELTKKFPSQICYSALHLFWTNEINASMLEIKSDKKALLHLCKKFNTQVSRIPVALNRNIWKSTDEPITQTQRQRLKSLTLGALYLRDSVVNLSGKKIKDSDDFEFSKLLKMKTMEYGNDGEKRFQLSALGNTYELGYEFQGSLPTIAWTPNTEKYLLALLFNLDHQKISCIVGVSQSGKSMLITELARITNRYHVTKHCQSNLSVESLTNFMCGLISNGCWGVLDNIEYMDHAQLSVTMVMIGEIKDALKQKKDSLALLEKKEILLNPKTNLFVTSSLSSQNFEIKIPGNIREEFRIISIVPPDLLQVLKWYCVHFNYRVARTLALRLQTVIQQSRELLDERGQPIINLRSVISALNKASSWKKSMVLKEKSGSYDAAQTTGASTLIEFWPSFIERKIKSPTSSFIKQKSNETPVSLSPAAKHEHNLVVEALIETILPSVIPENEKTMKEILKDTFQSYSDSHAKNIKETIPQELLNAIIREVKLKKISLSNSLMEKYVQLYNVVRFHEGIILCGPTFSGKSTSLEILIAAMNHICENQSVAGNELSATHDADDNASPKLSHYSNSKLLSQNHHVYTMYPMIFEDANEMFGKWSAKKEDFRDGLFTFLWKRVNRNDLVSWMIFDGAIQSEWSQNLRNILDDEHSLHLPDGNRLSQSKNVKFIFEMDTMKDAAPGMVSRSGVVYFPANIIGWREVKTLWLDNKRSLEVIALTKIFDKVLDPVVHYVTQNHKEYSANSVTIAFQNSLQILSQMLINNKDIGGELHIQRLFIFCFIWTLNSQIMDLNKQGITALLKRETTVLPDDDNSICIFDYFVDESGEWDLWSSLLMDEIDSSGLQLTGNVLVDTISTLRTKYLLDIATRASLNVSLIGPKGSGKSLILDNHWRKLDLSTMNVVRFVYSYFTKSNHLKSFLEANIEHRQGLMYGGKEHKHLTVIIEDLNMPKYSHIGSNYIRRPNEILRQLLNSNTIQNSKYPFEQMKLSDFNIIVTISNNKNSENFKTDLGDPRLMRHFVPITIEGAEGPSLSGIVRGIFESHMNTMENCQITIDQSNQIMSSTQKLFEKVSSVLQKSFLDGRQHLIFTLKNVNDVAIGIRSFNSDSESSESILLQYWTYLMKKIFQDSLVLEPDLKWFNTVLTNVIQDVWSVDILNDNATLNKHFITFSLDDESSRISKETPNISSDEYLTTPPVALDDIESKRSFLNLHINQHREKYGKSSINLMPTDNVFLQVVNIHRQITKPFNGHAVVVGSIGCHLSQLCRLALQIAKIPLQKLDTTNDVSLIDSMKSILRHVGSEGKKGAILLTARSLNSSLILETLNSLMISGDSPLLFPPDEMAGLLSAVLISLKREKSSTAALTNFDLIEQFRSRIRRDLHILICLPPHSKILKESLSKYPGILTYASVNWIKDSEEEYLSADASYFVKNSLNEMSQYLLEEKDQNQFIQYLTSLHKEVLKLNTKPSLISGKAIKIGKIIVNDKKKEIYKYDSTPVAPYSQLFLREKLRKLNDNSTQKKIYNGPCTFHRFLYILRRLLSQKTIEKSQSTQTITRVLNSIKQTKHDIITINGLINRQKTKFNEISVKSKQLLKTLIDKVTLLRIILTKKGDNSFLNEILSKNSVVHSVEYEKDPLLAETEKDELDIEFDKIREESLKNRKNFIKETLEKTRKEYWALKKELAYATEQVGYWKSKIDRQVIDRIKSFQNPPALVIDVIEMTFILIGKQMQNSRKDSSIDEEDTNEEKSNLKSHWKRMQQFMADPAKFVDILHNVSWRDGLNQDVYNGVKSYLATSKDGQFGVTGEGSLLNQAENVNFKAKKTKVSPDNVESDGSTNRAISVSATKYASEDAALLVQYAVALIEYTEKCEPLRQALQKVHELEIEFEETENSSENSSNENDINNYDYMTLNFTDEEVENLKLECAQIETDYNALIGDRSIVETELKALSERLEMSVWLVDNIKPMETKWQDLSGKYNDERTIFVQSLISSAYLAYGGPLSYEQRIKFLDHCVSSAKTYGLVSEKFTCTKSDITYFLHSEIEISKMETFGLSCCEDEIDNAYFIINESLIRNWILISDQTRRVINWLRHYLVKYNPTIIPYSDFHNRLENCLSSGQCVILTDCDIVHLSKDATMRQIFKNQYRFLKEKKPFKLILGNNHEVECHPNFRLFLHTCSATNDVPDVLISLTFLVSFNMSMPILISEFLSRFIEKAKPTIDVEYKTILHEKGKMRKKLHKLEEQMLEDLSNGVRNVKSIENCKTIIKYLKMYDEINNNLQQKEFIFSSNKKSIENYQQIAVRFATIFQMAFKMMNVQKDYFVDFEKYMNLFDSMIESCDRLSNKSIIEKITKKASQYSLLSMKDENKFIFCLLLSIEIHKTINHVELYQEEYLISPLSVAQKFNPDFIKQNESKSSNSKKPFDWMTEDSVMNVKILATCLPCFKDILENMYKDSKENLWKMIFEGDAPESSNFTEKIFKNSIDPFQKLCLIRTLRPDRILQASYLFIQSTLNLKFKGSVTPSDIRLAIQATSPTSAILLKYLNYSNEANILLNQLQFNNKSHHICLRINDNSTDGLQLFFQKLQNEIATIHESCFNTSTLSAVTSTFNTVFIIIHLLSPDQIGLIHTRVNSCIDRISSTTSELSTSKSRDQNTVSYFVFFTLQSNNSQISDSQLYKMTTVYLDYPSNVRDFFLHLFKIGFTSVTSNSIASSDFLPIIHNCSLLMSIIKSRSSYPSIGFHDSKIISGTSNPSNMNEIVEKLYYWFDTNSGIPWNMLRYFVSEIIYGNRLNSEFDRLSLNYMVDFWITSNAIRKEFEFPKLKYHCPSVLYSPNVKLSDIKKAFSVISPFLFESAEACHLSSNPLTKTNMEKTLIDKIQKVNQAINGKTVASFNIDISKVENELFEILKTLSGKLPKSTIESIQDRLKKVTNNFIYTKVMTLELTQYHAVFSEISSFIQKARKVIMNDMVNSMNDDEVSVVYSLLKNQIPDRWMNKLINSKGYNGYSTMEWLASLLSKYQHIERLILTNKDKVACYWLGAFQKPETLISIWKEEVSAQFIRSDRSGNYKDMKYLVEFTNRDKDHIREAPADGVFVHGLYLWGCGYDKMTGELTDVSNKGSCTSLPVVHVTFTTNELDKPDNPDQYNCPIFIDSASRQDPILNVTISKEGIAASKWMLRGVFITVNPF